MKRHDILAVLLLASSALLCAGCDFVKHKIGNQPEATYICVADMDNDDELDIVTANTMHMEPYDSEVSWFRNNGTDNWEKITVWASGGYEHVYNATGVAVADIDKDGRNDIVVATSGLPQGPYDQDGGCLYWFKAQDNSGKAWEKFDIEIEAGDKYYKVYTVDPNHDGYPDIVVGGRKSGYIFVNRGGEYPSWEKVSLPEGTGLCINVEDMNNDGNVDVLSSNFRSRKISWIDVGYDGSYSFTEHIVCQELEGAFDIMAIDIVGNDERKDLVVTKIGDPGIHWFEAPSEDDGEWIAHVVDAEFEASDVYTGDINNDGQTDFVVAGFNMGMGDQPDSVAWFEYVRDGDEITWAKHYIDGSIKAPGDISLNHVNHDEYPDVVTVSYATGDILWYENRLGDRLPVEQIILNKAVACLRGFQNPDGGFPFRIQVTLDSDFETTTWATRGLIMEGAPIDSETIQSGVNYILAGFAEQGYFNEINTAHTAFALLSLLEAGVAGTKIEAAVTWLKNAQLDDGGWGRALEPPSSTLYTGVVMAALSAAGMPPSDPVVRKAIAFCKKRQNKDGGWPMITGDSWAMRTSWVLQGLLATGVPLCSPLIRNACSFVLSCQQEDGGFTQRPDTSVESDPELTAYAILSLAGIDGHAGRLHQAALYLHSAQQEDGAFVSATPIEIQEPEKNLQTTSFVVWALHTLLERSGVHGPHPCLLQENCACTDDRRQAIRKREEGP